MLHILMVTVAFDDGSTQEYGQIIKYDHYHVHHGYWRLFWTWKNISIKSDYSIDLMSLCMQMGKKLRYCKIMRFHAFGDVIKRPSQSGYPVYYGNRLPKKIICLKCFLTTFFLWFENNITFFISLVFLIFQFKIFVRNISLTKNIKFHIYKAILIIFRDFKKMSLLLSTVLWGAFEGSITWLKATSSWPKLERTACSALNFYYSII